MFREFVDVLEEYQFDTFSLVGDLNDEAIAAPKGVFVGDVYAGDHHVDTLIVKGGKAGSGGFQKLVTGMFHIVLVVGIVDHALQVTS